MDEDEEDVLLAGVEDDDEDTKIVKVLKDHGKDDVPFSLCV